MIKGMRVIRIWVLVLATVAVSARAQLKRMPRADEKKPVEKQDNNKPPTRQVSATKTAQNSSEKIKTRADSMMYRREKGVIEAKGNVVIIKGDQELRADFVIVNTVSEEADAYGNVVMKRGEEVWRGERLHYNFRLGIGDSDSMLYSAAPFTMSAGKIEKIEGGRFKAKHSKLTTCANGLDHPHFCVRAREVVIDPGNSIKGKHTVFFIGRLPIFYLPYWYRSLDESTGWRFRAGYRSNWGAYLLSSYRYPMGDLLRGETHLDYRTDRGVAVGQDFGWASDSSVGEIELYYLDDDMPLDEDDDPDKDIDSSRYRVKLKNTSIYSERETLYVQAEYVSDIDFREDFFEEEYEKSVQPDNYIVYGHRGDHYTVDVLARARLNDFYDGVNRIPEVSLNVLRQPLGNSLMYYESQTYLSNLERVHVDGSSETDYSAMRIDSTHQINYPGKYFGFLTAIPRLGVRETYYSATSEQSTSDNVVTVATTNSAGAVSSSTQTNTVTVYSDGPSELRNRFELGVETSLKAYKTWNGLAGPRRHVVEPYANYTFVPEPNVLPEDLYQFDSVDTLGKEHWIQLGVRNKYQKKVANMPFDIMDINLYTILLLEREEGQDLLSNFYFDGRLQPGLSTLITFDGYYDTTASELARFNTRLEYNRAKWWAIGSEYHYVVDESSLVSADVTLYPDRAWTWNAYGRYDAEEGRAEEAGGYIQRNLDCMSLRTRVSVLPGYTKASGSQVEDEWRVMLEFWLSAFPKMRISAKHGG